MTDQTQQPTQSQPTPPPTGPLDELVGQDKKFKTVEALAKGKQESDAYIGKLESENKELRDLVTASQTKMQEIEAKLNFMSELKSVTQPTQSVTTPDPAKPTVTTQKGLTEEDVVKVMERARTEERRTNNIKEANAALVAQFGSEASAVITLRASELGVTKEYLTEMAAQSPQAFYATVGFSPKGSSGNQTLSSRVQGQTVSGGNMSKAGLRNKAYYDDLKKTMGAWKFSTDSNLQKQMWRDMQELGDRFES